MMAMTSSATSVAGKKPRGESPAADVKPQLANRTAVRSTASTRTPARMELPTVRGPQNVGKISGVIYQMRTK